MRYELHIDGRVYLNSDPFILRELAVKINREWVIYQIRSSRAKGLRTNMPTNKVLFKTEDFIKATNMLERGYLKKQVASVFKISVETLTKKLKYFEQKD